MKHIFYGILILGFLLSAYASCAVTLPSIFSDNMVIQQQKPFKIWGWSRPCEKISIELLGKTEVTNANDVGEWSITFPKMKASFIPLSINIKGQNLITINNVLIGEVWLCSGQSNMEWPVKKSMNGNQEIAQSNNSTIRFFTVKKTLTSSSQKNCDGQWLLCNPSTIGDFSAIGYFFGRELQRELNVPVGLIGSYWGGTFIESWIPIEYLDKLAFMKEQLHLAKKQYADIKSVENFYEKNVITINEENAKLATHVNTPESIKKYSSPDFNDASWKCINLPCAWENSELGLYDGIVWFRRTVNIPAEMAGKDIILSLGKIDDFDITYFNGQEVGKSGIKTPTRQSAYDKCRKYKIPAKLTKVGNNVIAIQATDDFLDGGMTGPSDEMYIITLDKSTKRIPLTGKWKYNPICKFKPHPFEPNTPNIPSRLYMGMINPITNYTIRGVIWYHGEANVSRASHYRLLMPLLIEAWRNKWSDPNLVFIQTQLANYMPRQDIPVESDWAELREAQLMSAMHDNLAGIAITIDIGQADDIHPQNKQSVAKRLAKIARKFAYGQDIQYSSPIYKTMEIKDQKAYITFNYCYGGLHYDGNIINGFCIAGDDRKFVHARAYIENGRIVVWSEKIEKPVAVRYGWANNPTCNLYNSANLPASPFRTDDWQH